MAENALKTQKKADSPSVWMTYSLILEVELDLEFGG